MAEQQLPEPGYPYDTTNYPDVFYDPSQGCHDIYTHPNAASGCIPAPQFLKSGPTGHGSIPTTLPLPPPTGSQALSDLRPHPHPRPRPIPNSVMVPSPTPVHAPMPAPASAPAPVPRPTSSKIPPTAVNADKGKGRAVSGTPCPPAKSTTSAATGSFVGHGLMNPVQFNRTPVCPSGLRLKRSPTPENPYFPSTFLPTKPEPEPSSPIDLCASSDVADEDNVESVAPVELVDIPEEWGADAEVHVGEDLDNGEEPDELEGFKEAHQRAASTIRSSSPASISELKEIIKKGGSPVMDPDELHAFLVVGRRGKLWLLVEQGLIIMYIFDPKAPEDHVQMVLRPLNLRRPGPLWDGMSRNLFLAAQNSSAIAQAFVKIMLVYKDIWYMIEVRGFSVNLTLPKEQAIRSIKTALNEAREDGAPLTSIVTPSEYYHWIDQPWYELVDVHGQVVPRPAALAGTLANSKEKCRREDENPLSPCAWNTIRPHTDVTLAGSDVDSSAPPPALSEVAPADVNPPHATHPQAQNAVAGPSTAAPSANANPSAKPGTVATDGLAGALLETCASAHDFKEQLLSMRKVQLEIDARNVDHQHQLFSEEQAGMEQERLHWIELEEEHVECEAVEMEERINRDREGQFFGEIMTTLNHEKVEDDIVVMLNRHLRERFKQKIESQQPFVAPHNPSHHNLQVQSSLAHRAALAPAPGPSSPLTVTIPKLGMHTPLVSSHTLVTKPAPSATNPPEGPMSPSHARSSLATLDQPPPLSKPADPIPTVTRQLGMATPTSANPGSLVSSGVPAPPCLHLTSISDSSTAPVSMISGSLLLSVVSMPPCPGPVGISGPSTAPASMIPGSLVSSTVAPPPYPSPAGISGRLTTSMALLHSPSVISAASTSVPGQTRMAPALVSCPPAPPNSVHRRFFPHVIVMSPPPFPAMLPVTHLL
ncbi:hypothetical protein FRC11_009613 [Ceratobasidium sp. 423]|nr:hypothetical protein FRC11_009613 [Ceratobasidium sp. 423]